MAPRIGQKHDQSPRRRSLGTMILLVLSCLVWAFSPARAAELPAGREFQVKAVFLYNFAQFVEWPADAFSSPTSPLVIGVLGVDPFGDFLDQTVTGESVNGHPLVVERYATIEDLRPCHILYISGSMAGQSELVASALSHTHVLTVADANDALSGTMVRFAMERNRVRLRINLESARQSGLNISSKLLRSAEIVTR
jgi:hypothetical protein